MELELANRCSTKETESKAFERALTGLFWAIRGLISYYIALRWAGLAPKSKVKGLSFADLTG